MVAGSLPRTVCVRNGALKKEIAMEKNYDYDAMTGRKTGRRWAFLIGTTITVLSITTAIGSAMMGALGFYASSLVGAAIGFSIGVTVMLKLFPRFWVVVPQTTAFVTTNQFAPAGANPNIPYGPGGHPAFPWELRQESGNITLDNITVRVKEEVPTKTSAMIVDATMQFKFDLRRITTVVGIDESTIEQGLVAQVNEWLSNRLANEDGDDLRKQVRTIRDELVEEFTKTRAELLLDEYGVRVTGFQIASIDFPPKVQEARDAVEELRKFNDVKHILLGFATPEDLAKAIAEKHITAADVARARDDFLASSGNITKEVRRIDVTGLENAGTGAGIAAGFLGSNK